MLDAPGLAVGALLGGRYRVEARIGAGGMGVVYRAHDERLGRAVALKIVSQKGGPAAVRRLQREARAVASLDHRGIAMLFDVIDAADIGVVLVMELVRGESLRAMLEIGARHPREAARIVLDVAESLGAAHRAGLVHRDVKPDNIILRPDGRTALLDFGIAKAITDRSEESADPMPPSDNGDTTEGLVVGTPGYLAPEQALARADISGATDQFALGVVAFELLTGTSPWGTATTGTALIVQIVEVDTPRPSELIPELAGPVDDVILRALRKDPALRYPSIEEFGQALVGAIAHVSGLSSHPIAVRRPRPGTLQYAETLPARDDVTTASAPAAAVAQAGSKRLAFLAAGALLAVGAAFFAVRAVRARPLAPPLAATGTTRAQANVTYADLSPATRSPVASAAFHEAMLAFRDADDALAGRKLDATIAADPACGSAYLQRAILRRRQSWNGARANQLAGREDYVAAVAARDTMTARDRALLEAFEPLLNRLPSDVGATDDRLTTLAATSADAQLWDLLGRVRRQRTLLDSAGAAFDRELAIDRESAAALRSRASLFTARGDLHGAAIAYEQCFRMLPRASLCREGLATVLDWNGECDAFAQRAREYAALAPGDSSAVELKLSADAFAGVPRAALEEELQQAIGIDAVNDQAWLHEIYGELGDATMTLAKLEETAVAARDTIDFAYARQARLVDLWESGRTAEATELASTYDAKLAALPALDDIDQLPYVLSLLRHVGKMSSEEVQRRRAAWVERWLPSYSSPQQRFALWISAYARGVFDEADGKEAALGLAALVGELPRSSLFSLDRPWSDREAVARALFFAGHPRARDFVDDALRECTPNFYVFRTQYLSGLLFERAGDAAGACAAYAQVTARWAHAKPRSTTAEAAEGRMRALGCKSGQR